MAPSTLKTCTFRAIPFSRGSPAAAGPKVSQPPPGLARAMIRSRDRSPGFATVPAQPLSASADPPAGTGEEASSAQRHGGLRGWTSPLRAQVTPRPPPAAGAADPASTLDWLTRQRRPTPQEVADRHDRLPARLDPDPRPHRRVAALRLLLPRPQGAHAVAGRGRAVVGGLRRDRAAVRGRGARARRDRPGLGVLRRLRHGEGAVGRQLVRSRWDLHRLAFGLEAAGERTGGAADAGIERAGQAAVGGDGHQQIRLFFPVPASNGGAFGMSATDAASARSMRSMRSA